MKSASRIPCTCRLSNSASEISYTSRLSMWSPTHHQVPPSFPWRHPSPPLTYPRLLFIFQNQSTSTPPNDSPPGPLSSLTICPSKRCLWSALLLPQLLRQEDHTAAKRRRLPPFLCKEDRAQPPHRRSLLVSAACLHVVHPSWRLWSALRTATTPRAMRTAPLPRAGCRRRFPH
jgi:hypothetical protein